MHGYDRLTASGAAVHYKVIRRAVSYDRILLLLYGSHHIFHLHTTVAAKGLQQYGVVDVGVSIHRVFKSAI